MELEATWPRTLLLWWSCAWRSFGLFLACALCVIVPLGVLDSLGVFGFWLNDPRAASTVSLLGRLLAIAGLLAFSVCQILGIKFTFALGFPEFRLRAFSARSKRRLRASWELCLQLWWEHSLRTYGLTLVVAGLLLAIGTFSWECLIATWIVLSIGVTQHLLSSEQRGVRLTLWSKVGKERQAADDVEVVPGLAAEIMDIWGQEEEAA